MSEPASEKDHYLQGRLDVASPFELGQFLLLGRKTGALHLLRDDERGVLYVRNGRIVSAVGPDLRGGQDVAMKMIAWKEGTFYFHPEPVADSNEIEVGTESLLLETARRMDESGGEEEHLAKSLEKADELSRTFAAISATSRAGSVDSDTTPLQWLSEQPGRCLHHLVGHRLIGRAVAGDAVSFDVEGPPNPGKILESKITHPPRHEWREIVGRRFYLSWGTEGYRLHHPFPQPVVADHLEDPAQIAAQLTGVPAIAVYGPRGCGKSLLAALLVSGQAAAGFRFLCLTGVPTHDLGDGDRILHRVVTPGSKLDEGREMMERWSPDGVMTDLEPSHELAAFVQDCRQGSFPLVLTLRAPQEQRARESLAHLCGDAEGWRLLSPERVADGPKLALSAAAA